MSAYIVDKEHIVFLVKAAVSRAFSDGGVFSYYHEGERHTVDYGDDEGQIELANMIWNENVISIMTRYPNCKDGLPGPILEDNEVYEITAHDIQMLWGSFGPVQVIKACHCYQYQSCEHDGWETSHSKAFIKSLISHATRMLAGYDEAEWGCPNPMGYCKV